MSTSVKLSKEFVIFYADQAIARATDFTFEINKQTIDVSSLQSGDWKELMVDMKEWKVTFNVLVTRHSTPASLYSASVTYPKDALVKIPENSFIYISQQAGNINHNPYTDNGNWWKKVRYDYDGLLQELKESNTPLDIALRTNVVDDNFELGEGFITSVSKTGTVGDKATFSGAVEGTKDLETYTIT